MGRNVAVLLVALAMLPSARAWSTEREAEAPSTPPAEESDEAAPSEKPPTEGSGSDPATPEVEPDEAADKLPSYGETLVVTASRTEQQVLEAPVSITVVGPQQLETTPADNYADLLRGVPGVNVVQTSARDINLTARSPASTLATSQLAMVDGRSIYQDFFGFVMWDSLPVDLDELRQVEILRGPGSAIWGANALTGVVNVRTKTPREMKGGLFTVGGGEWGTRKASFRWADAFARGSYKVSASHFTQDPWPRKNTFGDGTPIPQDNEFSNQGTDQPKVDLRLDWEPHEGRRWSYKAGRAGTTGLLHTGIGPFSMDDSAYMNYGEIAWSRPMVDAKVYLNHIDGDATNLLNRLPFAFENKTWVADVAARKVRGEKQLWVFGGNARVNDFDLSLAPGESTRREMGVFVEDQVAPNDKLLLALGLRVDWFDTIGIAISPRTSVIFKVRPRHSIRLAYNRAYRAPSLINNYLNTAVPNQEQILPPPARPFVFLTLARGNRDLNEESVDAFEVGYTGVFGSSTFTAAVYRNVTTDNIDFHPALYYSTADPPAGWPQGLAVPERRLVKEYNYRNIGRVVDHGVELSWNQRFGNHVGLTASYTWQADSDASGDAGAVAPLVVNRPARNQASAAVHVLWPKWRGSLSVSHQDRAFWTDVLDERFWAWTDSFDMVSGGVTWSPRPTFEVAVNATNALNERIKQHAFGDEIRRKVSAELRWRW